MDLVVNLSSRTCPTPLCGQCGFTFDHRSYVESVPLDDLRANALPCTTERATIQGHVDRLTEDVARYEHELMRLKQAVAVLEEEKLRVEAYRDHWTSLLAPVRRLPLELLERLFYEYALCITSVFKIDPIPKPHRVSAVCVHWRKVALDSPRLWSSISLTSNIPLYWGRGEHKVDLLKSWLGLSKTFPLSIHLSVDGTTALPFTDQIYELLAHSSRWRELDLFVQRSEYLSHLTRIRGRLDSLEQLRISGDVASAMRLFTHVPRLHKVALSVQYDLLTVGLPYQRLTSLIYERSCDPSYSYITVPTVLDVLASCPVLCEARFESIHGENEAPWTRSPVQSGIEFLSLAFGRGPSTGGPFADMANPLLQGILENLEAHRLISLHIIGSSYRLSNEPLPWPDVQLGNFIASTRLESLNLRRLYLDPRAVLHSLEHAPHLRSLSLEDNMWAGSCFPSASSFFKAMAYSPATNLDASTVLVPRLSKFTFTAHKHLDALQTRALVDMVRTRSNPWARWDSVPALEKVSLQFVDATKLESDFDEVRKDGLNVSLYSKQ